MRKHWSVCVMHATGKAHAIPVLTHAGVDACARALDNRSQRDEKRASDATSALFRNLVVDRIEGIIDENQTITHLKLAEEIDQAIGDEKIMRKKVKLPSEVGSALCGGAGRRVFALVGCSGTPD